MLEYPEEVTVLYVDKVDIEWLQEKDVPVEFMVFLNQRNLEKDPVRTRVFWAYYYGQEGNEVYSHRWQLKPSYSNGVLHGGTAM